MVSSTIPIGRRLPRAISPPCHGHVPHACLAPSQVLEQFISGNKNDIFSFVEVSVRRRWIL